MIFRWGILGPGSVESTRRVRTLQLAASTRNFNDLAVPGLGGAWFAKPLFLATCGVLIAERALADGHHVTKISVANAIEAVACWLALQTGQDGGGRIRGSTKLAGRTANDLSFGNVSRPSFYVTQPMRMATVAALPALGLVDASGSRFNSFTCSQAGLDFIEAASRGYRPYNGDLLDYLKKWVVGNDPIGNTPVLRNALSPLTPLSKEARLLLRERLHQGSPSSPQAERLRRRDALHWVESRSTGDTPIDWDEKPEQITDEHWADIRAGASFFAARDAALAVLDRLETSMGTPENRFSLGNETLNNGIRELLNDLRVKAQEFLNLQHSNADATAFCRESVQASDSSLLRQLVQRDGRILRLIGDDVCAGPAFNGGDQQEETTEPQVEESPQSNEVSWPENISYRIPNLWWLSHDLNGQLDTLLNAKNAETPDHG